MPNRKAENVEAKPIPGDSLPPEFAKHDYPFGIKQHVFNLIYIGFIIHPLGLYWMFYLLPLGHVPFLSFFRWVGYGYFGAIGISVGAHRYWTHRCFKANLKLRYLLMFMLTSVMQYPIFKWSKYMDTNADPHNAARGFWFSHIFWLFQPKHPECAKAMDTIEVSDMANDPVVRFQSKYYWELVLVWFYIIPIGIAHLLWPEMTLMQLIAGNFGRFLLILHFSATLNSVVHAVDMDGPRPYDKGISPVQNTFIGIIGLGEGWHNYHHTFPWDYRISEFGRHYNMGTVFIDIMAKIGWAWDLKTVSTKMLTDRINRTGDGSHPLHDHSTKLGEGNTASRNVWGWGDESIQQEDAELTKTRFPSRGRSY